MCGDKHRYHTKRFAKKRAKTMAQSSGLGVYRCPYCHFWHIGHKGSK